MRLTPTSKSSHADKLICLLVSAHTHDKAARLAGGELPCDLFHQRRLGHPSGNGLSVAAEAVWSAIWSFTQSKQKAKYFHIYRTGFAGERGRSFGQLHSGIGCYGYTGEGQPLSLPSSFLICHPVGWGWGGKTKLPVLILKISPPLSLSNVLCMLISGEDGAAVRAGPLGKEPDGALACGSCTQLHGQAIDSILIPSLPFALPFPRPSWSFPQSIVNILVTRSSSILSRS